MAPRFVEPMAALVVVDVNFISNEGRPGWYCLIASPQGTLMAWALHYYCQG